MEFGVPPTGYGPWCPALRIGRKSKAKAPLAMTEVQSAVCPRQAAQSRQDFLGIFSVDQEKGQEKSRSVSQAASFLRHPSHHSLIRTDSDPVLLVNKWLFFEGYG
nr:hypothetical protein [Sphingomonas sp. Y57]